MSVTPCGCDLQYSSMASLTIRSVLASKARDHYNGGRDDREAQTRRGFVKQDDARLANQHARNGDAHSAGRHESLRVHSHVTHVPLASRQLTSIVADLCIVAVGEAVDKLMRVGLCMMG